MSDRTSLPDLPEITWEIGTAELQKSVMAVETFGTLKSGEANVRRIRDKIRLRASYS